MSAAACLLAYSLLVGAVAPRALRRRAWIDRVPGVAVAIWLSAMLSVVVALAGGVALAVAAIVRSPTARHVLDECIASLCSVALGDHGSATRWAVGGAVVLAGVGVVTAAVSAGRALVGLCARTRAHVAAAGVLGQPDARLGALVVDVPEKVVYAVGGRCRAIVVSRAAVQALSDQELDVVLAHERAHLTGHHHLVLNVARVLATAVPSSRLFSTGLAELARLVEMCADDAAVRGRDVRDLITAMLALSSTARLPHSALGGASVGLAERAERLTERPSRGATRTARGGILLAGAVGLLVGPLATVLVLCGGLPLVA